MWTFHAMGTDVTVAAPELGDEDEAALAREVARMFADAERRFSRFRDDSELAALNRATEPMTVSPELLELLDAARAHVTRTGGIFDPTVGAALCSAGYDRSFSPGSLDRDALAGPPPPARFDEIEVEEHTRRVTRPPHVLLDFGGFLKGRTVDHAAALAPSSVMVDAGGDAMLHGAGMDGAGWPVDVEDPYDARSTVVTLRVRDRGVATSSPNRRRWRMGAQIGHHLIDPRTAAPSRSDLAQVTVVAPTAELADVLAKAAFLLGIDEGTRLISRDERLGAVLVTTTGELRFVGNVEVEHA